MNPQLLWDWRQRDWTTHYTFVWGHNGPNISYSFTPLACRSKHYHTVGQLTPWGRVPQEMEACTVSGRSVLEAIIEEYLPILRQWQKTYQTIVQFCQDGLVFVANKTLPWNQWSLGRIVETLPSTDGIVRQAKVKTVLDIQMRTVTKLCLLEGAEDMT